MDRQDKDILQLAHLAGRILIQSEAEGYRVERTVRQILSKSQLEYADAFSSASGLFINIESSSQDETESDETTLVIRVNNRQNHMRCIHQVHQVTDRFMRDEITSQEAIHRLQTFQIEEYSTHNNFVSIIALIMCYVGILNGSPGDLVISLIPAILILFFELSDDRFGLNRFSINVLMTAALAFVLPLIDFYVTPNFNLDIVIAATLMPLYPGTAFTNAIRDFLHGDYSTGLTRAIDAIILGLSLALGTGIGLALSRGVIHLWT